MFLTVNFFQGNTSCADLISLSFPRGKSLIKALYAIIILNVLYSQKGNPLLIADIMSNLSSSS